MTQTQPNAFDDLRFALAEAGAHTPPRRLITSVLARALTARPAGVPVDAPPPIDPIEAFRRAVSSFDQVLGSLDAREWRQTALRGLDVQGLVGHVIGVEHGFVHALDATDDAHADDDHITSTDPYATEQHGRDPDATYDAWRAVVGVSMARLEDAGRRPDGLQRTVSLFGLRMPLHTWLVVRAFELWTHEEDIRRATARPLVSPDAATLRLMTALAVGLVPAGIARAAGPAEGRSARIVLTGPGGGAWQTRLGLSDVGPVPEGLADVRIVADAADFCRVVANRLDAQSLDADITGDLDLARDLLAGAATLALD